MEVTRITAVRHGETAWNVDTRIQGQLDIGLNAKGCWQAERVGAALAQEDISVVYSSDLCRAYDTALSIAQPHGLVVQTDEACASAALASLKAKLSPTLKPPGLSKRCSGASAYPTTHHPVASRCCSYESV